MSDYMSFSALTLKDGPTGTWEKGVALSFNSKGRARVTGLQRDWLVSTAGSFDDSSRLVVGRRRVREVEGSKIECVSRVSEMDYRDEAAAIAPNQLSTFVIVRLEHATDRKLILMSADWWSAPCPARERVDQVGSGICSVCGQHYAYNDRSGRFNHPDKLVMRQFQNSAPRWAEISTSFSCDGALVIRILPDRLNASIGFLRFAVKSQMRGCDITAYHPKLDWYAKVTALQDLRIDIGSFDRIQPPQAAR